jgi:phosphoesterase RecJ-like protein
MLIGGKMIDLGVDPAEINNRIFFENSFSALRTIGAGLANLESYFNGAVNIIYLNYEQMNSEHQGEIEELANYSVAIRGGQVGLFIREVKPGFHKISLRSKSHVDVNRVAKAFDGGGHTRAAGCRVEGTKEQVIQKILGELKKHLSA